MARLKPIQPLTQLKLIQSLSKLRHLTPENDEVGMELLLHRLLWAEVAPVQLEADSAHWGQAYPLVAGLQWGQAPFRGQRWVKNPCCSG